MEQPPELMTLAFAAFDHAIDSVGRSGGPLGPFVMQASHGAVRVHRFVAATTAESLAEARAFAWRLGPEGAMVALAYDGHLVIGDVRTPAIYVQVQALDQSISVVFAQRYERVDGGVREIDRVKLVEPHESPLVGVG